MDPLKSLWNVWNTTQQNTHILKLTHAIWGGSLKLKGPEFQSKFILWLIIYKGHFKILFNTYHSGWSNISTPLHMKKLDLRLLLIFFQESKRKQLRLLTSNTHSPPPCCWSPKAKRSQKKARNWFPKKRPLHHPIIKEIGTSKDL